MERAFLLLSTRPLVSRSLGAGSCLGTRLFAFSNGHRPTTLALNRHSFSSIGVPTYSVCKSEAYFVYAVRICHEGARGTKTPQMSGHRGVAHMSPGRSITSLWLRAIFLLSRVHRNWCRLDASFSIVLLEFRQVTLYNHRSSLALLN